MTDAQDRWEARLAEHTVYRRPGGGPAVVLLNGCGLASVAWDAVVEALPGRAVIAVDRPGRCGTVNDGLPDLRQEARILSRIIGDDAVRREAEPVCVLGGRGGRGGRRVPEKVPQREAVGHPPGDPQVDPAGGVDGAVVGQPAEASRHP